MAFNRVINSSGHAGSALKNPICLSFRSIGTCSILFPVKYQSKESLSFAWARVLQVILRRREERLLEATKQFGISI